MYKLVTLEKEEYENFTKNHIRSHFLHSYAWGEVSKTRGQIPHYLGVKENDKIVATALLLEKKLLLGYTYFYIPRGFVLDYDNEELLKFISKEIGNYTKKHKSLYFLIDPDIKLHTIDKDAKRIDGEDNYKLVNLLKSIGYKHKKLNYFFEGNQPRFTFRVNTKINEDEIRSNYSKSVRRWIKIADKFKVNAYRGKKDELNEFIRLMKMTEKRQGFFSHNYDFYPKLYDILEKEDMIYLLLAKVNINDVLEELNKELNEDPSRKEKLEGLINHYTELKKNGEIQVVSSYINIEYGNKSWYLYGANDMDFKDCFANYKLFDYQIMLAHNLGKDLLDEFGTVGKPNSKKSGASLHEFKQKFGGEYTEFIGEFMYITNKPIYTIFSILIPIKRKISKFINHTKVKHNKGE